MAGLDPLLVPAVVGLGSLQNSIAMAGLGSLQLPAVAGLDS